MASLELLVDAAGVSAGAQVARAGLDSIIEKGMKAADAMDDVSSVSTVTGASMQQAFGAAKGGLQVTSGLQGVIDGLGGAIAGTRDFSSVLQGMGRTLLEIGRAKDDWRNLSTAMVTTSSVAKVVERDMFGIAIGVKDVITTTRTAQNGFGALWLALKANPIAAAVGALGLVATAMSLFGDETEKTTKAVERQADALDQLLSRGKEIDFRRSLGAEDPRATRAGSIDALSALQFSGRQTASITEVANLLGMSEQDLRLSMFRAGNEDAMAMRPAFRAFGQRDGGYAYARSDFDVAAYINAGKHNIIPSLEREKADTTTRGPSSPYGLGPLFRPNQPGGLMTEESNGVLISGADQARVDAENRRAQLEESVARMREMAQLSQQIGSYLGDAATDLVLGLRSGREVLSQMLSDLARMGLRSAATQITQSFLTGFGTPAAQGNGNLNLPGPD